MRTLRGDPLAAAHLAARPALLRAVLVSLAIHALVLAGVQEIRRPVREQPIAAVLRANLRQDARLPAPPQVAESRPTEAPAPVERPPPVLQAPAAVPMIKGRPQQTSAAPSPVAAPVTGGAPASRSEPQLSPAAPPTATEPPAPAAPVVAAPEPGPAVDGEDLKQYRLSLSARARQFKRYPALARERGWQGTTEVAVVLAADSPMPRVALEKSSGHPVLDEQAIEMIRRASRVASIPGGLQQRGIRVIIPVHFNLDE